MPLSDVSMIEWHLLSLDSLGSAYWLAGYDGMNPQGSGDWERDEKDEIEEITYTQTKWIRWHEKPMKRQRARERERERERERKRERRKREKYQMAEY